MKALARVIIILTGMPVFAIPVQAKSICGWYAIATCVQSEQAAGDFASRGWGAVIDTNKFAGLRRNYFCVVSGPQSNSSAQRDRRAAIANGVAADTYIKRACTDERNIGD